jgi:hypothetical protein
LENGKTVPKTFEKVCEREIMSQELNIMDEVIINTDTIFDEEGVPVSIRNGAHARLWELKDNWAQVIVWFHSQYPGEEGKGIPEMFGVDIKHLSFHSHIKHDKEKNHVN